MTPTKITTIPVFPSTHVRVTQNELWISKADETYLHRLDEKKREEKGKPGGLVRRQRQIIKALDHKQEVKTWVSSTGYVLPNGYFAVWFMVPMPKSWRKKKRLEMEGKPHENMPDWDNFSKQLFDALRPRKVRAAGEKGSDDSSIHTVAVFKRWAVYDNACIKLVEYDAGEFEAAFSLSR